MARVLKLLKSRRAKWFAWSVLVISLLASFVRLELERATVSETIAPTAAGPVSIYRNKAGDTGPLIMIAHGFAGSRQMMQYISRTLARDGFTVAAFDFMGHGRNRVGMSPQVTEITGTTQQLVDQTVEVARSVQSITGQGGPIAFVGHSMATDIVVRAAQAFPDVTAVVAISMYSDAVTDRFPNNLLVISGQSEERLRTVALDAVALAGGERVEGKTVKSEGVMRRAVAIPWTGHATVLFAEGTFSEINAWMTDAFGFHSASAVQPRGAELFVFLAALTALIWPISRILPQRARKSRRVGMKMLIYATLLPAILAWAGSFLFLQVFPAPASFAALTVFFAVWGGATLSILYRAGHRFVAHRWEGTALLLFWSLAVFALALDRYIGSFAPVGARFPVMLWLLVGTLPLVIAERMLLHGSSLGQKILARIVFLSALSAMMVAFPQNLGLLFSVLPVLVLYYAVYGSMAMAVARRSGPEAAGLAQAVVLAWAIASSTPLFA